MRVTRNLLLETARNHVKSQTLNNPDIACVFLVGSLLSDEPFIGETTDIDLVFIHNTEPAAPREVISMGDEFNLDILHFPRRIFSQPKDLRGIPGSAACFARNPSCFTILIISMISYAPVFIQTSFRLPILTPGPVFLYPCQRTLDGHAPGRTERGVLGELCFRLSANSLRRRQHHRLPDRKTDFRAPFSIHFGSHYSLSRQTRSRQRHARSICSSRLRHHRLAKFVSAVNQCFFHPFREVLLSSAIYSRPC